MFPCAAVPEELTPPREYREDAAGSVEIPLSLTISSSEQVLVYRGLSAVTKAWYSLVAKVKETTAKPLSVMREQVTEQRGLIVGRRLWVATVKWRQVEGVVCL